MDQKLSFFQENILQWYAKNKRDLPWRKTTDPYHILVSEFMLQQTQVDRVIPKYAAFLKQFPTLQKLAAASPADVIKTWAGLGYNRRAVNLHRLAQTLVNDHRGHIPRHLDLLEHLPGIGPYTASAIASFAYNADVPVLDVNIHRVLERYFALKPETPARQRQELRTLARALIPKEQGSTWHNALMDFGALQCTAHNPACALCILHQNCSFFAELQRTPLPERNKLFTQKKKTQSFIGSTRYHRGKIIAYLRTYKESTLTALMRHMQKEYHITDDTYLKSVIEGLKKDRLIQQEGTIITLPH